MEMKLKDSAPVADKGEDPAKGVEATDERRPLSVAVTTGERVINLGAAADLASKTDPDDYEGEDREGDDFDIP